jgi:hypothetical protein
MYLSRPLLIGLFLVGIFVIVSLVALVTGGTPALETVLTIASIATILIGGAWLLFIAARRIRSAGNPNPQPIPSFWALRLLSIILKCVSFAILLTGIFIVGLYVYNRLFTPLPRGMFGSFPIEALVSTPLIFSWLLSLVSPFAFAQFIDLMLSIESSLRTLAERRQPPNQQNPNS